MSIRKRICLVCVVAFVVVGIGFSLGTAGFSKKKVAEAAVEQPEKPVKMPAETGMDLEHLDAIIDDLGSDVQRQGGAWQFTFNEVQMVCYTDLNYDRMRIMTAIADMEDVTPEQAAMALDANFHSALDARYATNGGILYSAFIHPLSPLTDGEARSAIEQVARLAETFGTTYQSGELTFGQ